MDYPLTETGLTDDYRQYFKPVPSGRLNDLFDEYAAQRARIDQVGAIMRGDLGGVVSYFIEGNAGDERTHRSR